jgi:multiple sugar transport system permease protein
MAAPTRRWLLAAAALVLAAVVLFPIYWMALTSVLPSELTRSRTPALLPKLSALSLDAYANVLARKPVFTWLVNSVVVTVAATFISLVIATLAGYSLSRYKSRAQQGAGFALLVSKMLPASLIVIPFFIAFSTFGLIDSRWGLILANAAVGVPFATWLMKGFFDGIPREIELAAMLDGCNGAQAVWYVVLPLARPGIAASAIYLAIVTWSDFVFARTLVTSPDLWVLNVGLQSFLGEYLVDWSSLMAVGILSLAPVFVLFLLLEPFLVSGMTQGAVAN